MLFFAWKPGVASSEEPKFSEYEVKAAFILNALKFVDFPKGVTAGLSVCVLGDNPFGKDLDALSGKTVRDKVLTVKNIRSISEAKECSVVFICRSERERLGEILGGLSASRPFTMGDTEGFGERGVVLNFYQEAERIRFQINLEAAKKSGLSFDARLLKLATIVAAK